MKFPGIEYLENLPLWDGGKFSPLEVPKEILKCLGNPQDWVDSVHVAGTNGKGSVCSYLAAIFRATGANVGHFASPHLSHVTERCLINGQPVSADDFDRAIMEVAQSEAAKRLQPSYFVVGAAASFLEFARRKLDWMVIEVGLGGRYDATNLLKKPQASVITSVSFDHTHFLGERIEEIAWNKAGIIKTAVPVFVGKIPQKAEHVVLKESEQHKAEVMLKGRDWDYRPDTLELRVRDREILLSDLGLQSLTPWQQDNAMLAACVASYLGVSDENLQEGLRTARWPGRAEHISYHPNKTSPRDDQEEGISFLLDAAHNEEGIKSLICAIENVISQNRSTPRIFFILSMLERKSWKKMCLQLRSFVDKLAERSVSAEFFPTQSNSSQAVEPNRLAEVLNTQRIFSAPEEALKAVVQEANQDSLVVVSGSIFLLGQIRPMIVTEPFRTIVEEC